MFPEPVPQPCPCEPARMATSAIILWRNPGTDGLVANDWPNPGLIPSQILIILWLGLYYLTTHEPILKSTDVGYCEYLIYNFQNFQKSN